jgi:hypothetical protein
MKSLIPLFVLLLTVVLSFSFGGREKIAFALPVVAEWKTGNFTVEIKDWDNPLGTEGLHNSGLNKDTCTYKVESLNPAIGAWEITRSATQRTCAIPIPITVGLKTGEGYKGQTDIKVQTTDCKYSGENACSITAWAQDYAGNNSFGTEYMLTRIYSVDSIAPSVSVTNIKRTFPSDQVKDFGTPSSSTWLKAGIYEISTSITDNVGGSGVDTSYRPVTIRSRGVDDTFDTADDKVYSTTRTTDNKFSVWVGPDNDPSHPFNSSLNDCVNQNINRCRIEILARDLAGNIIPPLRIPLNIDYTAPTAQ